MKMTTSITKTLQIVLKSKATSIVVFLLLGVFLRLYGWQLYPFGFDQVQIIENAKNITEGNFTLIGPRTGPAAMFTGPLIYYLNALIYAFFRSIYSLIILNITIFIATYLMLLFTIKRSKSISFDVLTIIVFLYALSPFIVSLERIPWNPSLVFVSFLLVFFTLYKIVTEKKSDHIDAILLFIGGFLSYQAHFSGFILPAITFGIWFIAFRKDVKLLIAFTSGFILSLIPTIIFDYRNNWLNTQGLYELLFTDQIPVTTSIVYRQYDSLRITIENIGKVLLLPNTYLLIFFTGLTITLLYIFNKRNSLKGTMIEYVALIWIFSISFILAFYPGPKPEYYYLGQLPAILLIISQCLQNFSVNLKQKTSYVLLAMTPYLLLINIHSIDAQGMFKIKTHSEIQKAVQDIEKDKGISKIAFDLEEKDAFGIKFLLNDIQLNDAGAIVHVVYPLEKDALVSQAFGPAGIWIDPRTHIDSEYLYMNSYIIKSPEKVRLLQNNYEAGKFNGNKVFEITQNRQHIGIFVEINHAVDSEYYDEVIKLKQSQTSMENTKLPPSIELNGETFFIKHLPNKVLLSTLPEFVTDESIIR